MQQPRVILNDGRSMPQLGFGVWQVDNSAVVMPVIEAIRAGYRSIDTAQGYDNEGGVGEAIREAGVPRDELFITSKLRTKDQGFDETLASFEGTLERLRLDYLDLFLIHWPVPAHDKYAETWKAFVRLREEGRLKSIGVSNFLPEHIDRILDETGVLPAVNQIEIHPQYQQLDVRQYHKDKNIQLESYSPLGSGAVLDDDEIADIADKHGKSPAQVIIRWHLQQGLVVIPKSVTPERIRQNFEVFDFELDDMDMGRIKELDDPVGGKENNQPATMNDLF